MKVETHKIDLHIHTTVSDGTDTPEELLLKVKDLGLTAFSITDHDGIMGCQRVSKILTDSDPRFITGVEFNARDDEGKYHILGYGYDPDAEAIQKLVKFGHDCRMRKLMARLDFLDKEFGFKFSTEEVNELMARDNPGKPHIGNLMVSRGYAKSKEEAIEVYIDKARVPATEYIKPEKVIEGILASGGIPVLAHPPYGSGDELIVGDELDARVRKLMSFGLQGLEGFYSGFSKLLSDAVLKLASEYDLYVTAGSDYHGRNKMVILGDTSLTETSEIPEGLSRFLERASDLFVKIG